MYVTFGLVEDPFSLKEKYSLKDDLGKFNDHATFTLMTTKYIYCFLIAGKIMHIYKVQLKTF